MYINLSAIVKMHFSEKNSNFLNCRNDEINEHWQYKTKNLLTKDALLKTVWLRIFDYKL